MQKNFDLTFVAQKYENLFIKNLEDDYITILTSKNLHQNSIGVLYPLIKWKKKINSEKINFKKSNIQ